MNNVKNAEILKLQKKKNKTKIVINKQNVKKCLKNKKMLYQTKQQTKGVKVVQKDNTNKLLKGIVAICFVIMFVVLGQFFVLESGVKTQFSTNTTINGINVSQMDTFKAQEVVLNAYKEKAEHFELTLRYKDKEWKFNKNDFVVNSNIHTIIEEAYYREKANQNYYTQLETVKQIAQKSNDIVVAFNYIFTGLDEKIDQIINEINVKPINSEIKFLPNTKQKFEITKEVNGVKVNKEQLYYDINEQFLKTNKVVVDIPTLIDEAEVTYEDNLALTKKISSYKTNVSDSTGNRKENVKLDLKRINGLVVQPGESVSFNKLTGPHTLENGYKIATIILNGRFVDGVGGGICQASTTLYNALLLADVQIDQVVKHTLPVKYVPLGLDAMVAEGIADLKFTNTSNYPLFIETRTTSEDVEVIIYSHELEHGMTIKARSEIIKKLAHKGDVIKPDTKQEYTDKVLYKGEKWRLTYPRDGYETETYLDYYKDGKLITSKKIRNETYYPQQGIIIEGVLDKPKEFNESGQDVKAIKPNGEDEFLFNVSNLETINAIETTFCP